MEVQKEKYMNFEDRVIEINLKNREKTYWGGRNEQSLRDFSG